jgi:hypothetical protein
LFSNAVSWPEFWYALRYSIAPHASMVVDPAIGKPNLTWSPASYQPPVRFTPTSEPSFMPELPRQETRFQLGLVPLT